MTCPNMSSRMAGVSCHIILELLGCLVKLAKGEYSDDVSGHIINVDKVSHLIEELFVWKDISANMMTCSIK